MKVYSIHKGNHRSGLYFKPHYNLRELTYDVMFTDSCIYQLDKVNQFDINKLFGLSYGYHHTNSVRFGWRSVGYAGNKIDIVAYCYVNGQRVKDIGRHTFLTMIQTNKLYTLKIETLPTKYTLSVSDKDGLIAHKSISHSTLPNWGYHLFPYFGGDCVAPHDINIILQQKS